MCTMKLKIRMNLLKEKVTEKLSHLFAHSSGKPPSPAVSQARPFSKGEKSSFSYFSHNIPSVRSDTSQPKLHLESCNTVPSPSFTWSSNDFEDSSSLENGERQKMYEDGKIINPVNDSHQKFYNGKDEGHISRMSSSESDVDDQLRPKKLLVDLSDDSVFISPDLYKFLRSSLPNIVKGCKWVLMYSTLKHGISFRTLVRKSADLSGPCLLISGDKKGAIFGALLECPLKPTPQRKYQGTHQTFVFTTRYGEPKLFRPTGANRYYYMCLNDLLAFGGGGDFALRFDGDLLNGSSGSCDTFRNSCLAHNPEFELTNVEGFEGTSRLH